MNVTRYIPLIVMPALLLVVELASILLASPMIETGTKAFDNPDSFSNLFIFIAAILIFTAFILILIRFKFTKIFSIVILLSIFFSFIYVFNAILATLFPSNNLVFLISILISALGTFILYQYPEWYVINSLGALLSAGIAAIFGSSLSVIPVIVLLVLLAIYDAISVYRTKHMITLAEGVIKEKAPILFIIPKKRDFSYIKEGIGEINEGGERGAYIMGMGDLIMPSILVVSSQVFLGKPGQFMSLPTAGAIIGSLFGMLILLTVVGKGKPQAGLPPLNGCTIAGFLLGLFLSSL